MSQLLLLELQQKIVEVRRCFNLSFKTKTHDVNFMINFILGTLGILCPSLLHYQHSSPPLIMRNAALWSLKTYCVCACSDWSILGWCAATHLRHSPPCQTN